MTSITIHTIENELDKKIRTEAQKNNTSLNKTIKRLLKLQLGLSKKDKPNHQKEFEDLCGIWNAKETKKFQQSIKGTRKINSQDWE